ncbi:MAG: hypothetical protein HYX87_05635 [Chloroflexi bacterium]|nr:hypothetical protein [Chloroflexota bacterium]
MKVLDPTYSLTRPPVAPSAPLNSLGGKRVSFLDNGWASAGAIFTRLEAMLSNQKTPSRLLRKSIPLTGAAPPELLDEVAGACDAAIVALGN